MKPEQDALYEFLEFYFNDKTRPDLSIEGDEAKQAEYKKMQEEEKRIKN